ncbi:MAG: hypothetical protein NTZ72_06570 [Afipia sp.]|nr:hypothetical protein [Afipia sp.]
MTDKLPPLIPHLCVKGAIDAIEFYRKALGATEVMRMPADDGKRLMHAHLIINGAVVFLMDDFPEHRAQHGNIRIFLRKSRCRRGTPSGARAMRKSPIPADVRGVLRIHCQRSELEAR